MNRASLTDDAGRPAIRAELRTISREASIRDAAAAGIRGGGGTLPFLDTIQRSFGDHDVRNVQAHSDAAAHSAASAIGATAFAAAEHVAFGRAADLHTAAHEAAHVVQQRRGVHLTGGVGRTGDEYERHADRVADRVVHGQSAADLLGTPARAASQADAIQCVAAQIIPGDGADENKIIDVEIDARTESPFVGTMGAHTVAWCMVVDATRKTLVPGGTPLTIGQGILAMNGLTDEALKSDALKFISKIDDKHLGKLLAATSALKDIRAKAGAAGPAAQALRLQQYICAYLTFHNLLPYSTVDNKKTGGSGEGTCHPTLVDMEETGKFEPHNKKDGSRHDKPEDCFFGLLDPGALDFAADEEEQESQTLSQRNLDSEDEKLYKEIARSEDRTESHSVEVNSMLLSEHKKLADRAYPKAAKKSKLGEGKIREFLGELPPEEIDDILAFMQGASDDGKATGKADDSTKGKAKAKAKTKTKTKTKTKAKAPNRKKRRRDSTEDNNNNKNSDSDSDSNGINA